MNKQKTEHEYLERCRPEWTPPKNNEPVQLHTLPDSHFEKVTKPGEEREKKVKVKNRNIVAFY